MGAHAVLQGVAQEPIVDLRHAAHISPGPGNARHDLGINPHQLRIRQCLQRLHIGVGETQFRQHSPHDLFTVSLTGGHHGGIAYAAHDQSLVEQAVRRRDLHQIRHLHAAAGLAENGHVLRIAAKEGDIVMNPLQRRYHIRVTSVTGVFIFLTEGGQIQVAQNVQPMIYRNHHRIPLHAHIAAIIGHLLNGGTGRVSTPVEPDNNGLFRFPIQCSGPDIQVLAVLVHRPVAVRHQQLRGWLILGHQGADVAIGGGILDTRPLGGDGHLEPISIGIRNALENICAVIEAALQLAGSGFQYRHIVITE